MHIEAAKVKTIKNAALGPDPITTDAETDVKLAKAWIGFRQNLAKFVENAKSVAVELQFESSYDEKTHHSFNADEAVFIGDVKICPKNTVVFTVPFGAKEKTFRFSEAELINVIENEGGVPEQLNNVIGRLFRESFAEFKDIPNITMLERKYLGTYAGMAGMFNDADTFIATLELTKDRSKMYSKISDFGIF